MTTERPAGRRTGYNDHATRVGTGEDAAPPPKPTHACHAHGCPLWASVAIEGPRLCFVHAAIPERLEWDEATRRIRRQPALVEIVRALRRSEAPEILAKCLELCPQLASGDGSPTARYDALRRAEALLIAECTADAASSTFMAEAMPDLGPVAVTLTRDEKRQRVLANIRYIASHPGPMSAQLRSLVRTYERMYGTRCPVDLPRRRAAPAPALAVADRQPGEDDE